MVKAANEQYNDGFITLRDYGNAMVLIAVDYIQDDDNLGALAVLSYLPHAYFDEEMVSAALSDRYFAVKVSALMDTFGYDIVMLLETEAQA